ncbi:acyl-CoA N-acyltransferase [Hymenopellis radicata]|nr:acyl-CoA N-acyltransferase [Hymenopellis radicata]
MTDSDWTPDPNFSIETPRLIISHLLPDSLEHCEFLVDVYGSPAFISAAGKDLGIDTPDKARAMINGRVKAIHSVDGHGQYLVSEKTETTPRPVGMVSLVRSRPEHDPSTWLPFPDIGYAMHAEYAGKGYATEAARALIDYARANWGVEGVLGITAPWNGASVRVMEKLGMENRGTFNFTHYPPAVIWALPGMKDLNEYGFDKFIVEEAKS